MWMTLILNICKKEPCDHVSNPLRDPVTGFVSHMAPIQHMRWRYVAHRFLVHRSKIKVTWVVQRFCRVAPCLFHRFTSSITITQETTMGRVPFPGQWVRGQRHIGCSKLLPFPLRDYVPIFMDSIHIIVKLKGQRSWSHGSFEYKMLAFGT